jgi:hypothetical protein
VSFLCEVQDGSLMIRYSDVIAERYGGRVYIVSFLSSGSRAKIEHSMIFMMRCSDVIIASV